MRTFSDIEKSSKEFFYSRKVRNIPVHKLKETHEAEVDRGQTRVRIVCQSPFVFDETAYPVACTNILYQGQLGFCTYGIVLEADSGGKG